MDNIKFDYSQFDVLPDNKNRNVFMYNFIKFVSKEYKNEMGRVKLKSIIQELINQEHLAYSFIPGDTKINNLIQESKNETEDETLIIPIEMQHYYNRISIGHKKTATWIKSVLYVGYGFNDPYGDLVDLHSQYEVASEYNYRLSVGITTKDIDDYFVYAPFRNAENYYIYKELTRTNKVMYLNLSRQIYISENNSLSAEDIFDDYSLNNLFSNSSLWDESFITFVTANLRLPYYVAVGAFDKDDILHCNFVLRDSTCLPGKYKVSPKEIETRNNKHTYRNTIKSIVIDDMRDNL